MYDNRVFLPEEERRTKGGIMLVPDGAPDLKEVNRQPLINLDYTSAVEAFYVAP